MVVHHLADTEAFRSVRLRQLLAFETPVIQAFDELALSRRLHYDRPIEASLTFVRAAVEASLELLSQMSDEDWGRSGHHTEEGDFSMEEWLRRAANHLQEHAAQIRASTR
jgi:hypothetical protein